MKREAETISDNFYNQQWHYIILLTSSWKDTSGRNYKSFITIVYLI